jgi:sec-independent protein translocase protein TatB
MFDLSFGEIMLVVLVAVVFIGPNELPVVVKAAASAMRSVRGLMRELRGAFDDLAKESGLKDTAEEITKEIKMIKGDDGEMYESYDLSTVMLPKTTPKPQIKDEPKPEMTEAKESVNE